MKLKIIDPEDFSAKDYKFIRDSFPDKALVFWPGWMPLFWSACSAFGSEEALVKMICEPDIFDAYIHNLHDCTMEIIRKGLCIPAYPDS